MKNTTTATLEALTPEMFSHSDTGKIRAGIQWITSTDKVKMECFQFDTLEELQACVRFYQAIPAMLSLSIVTHTGQYKNMRTLFAWSKP
jgi:hypothetical protein